MSSLMKKHVFFQGASAALHFSQQTKEEHSSSATVLDLAPHEKILFWRRTPAVSGHQNNRTKIFYGREGWHFPLCIKPLGLSIELDRNWTKPRNFGICDLDQNVHVQSGTQNSLSLQWWFSWLKPFSLHEKIWLGCRLYFWKKISYGNFSTSFMNQACYI